MVTANNYASGLFSKNRRGMRRSVNFLLLFVIFIFSTITSTAIAQVVVISTARADSPNFTDKKDALQSLIVDRNNRTYVFNVHDNTLSILSGQTKTVIGNPATVTKYPVVAAFGPSTVRNTYLVNLHDNTLSILFGQTKTVINSAGATSFGLAKVYIPNSHKVLLYSAIPTKPSVSVAVKTPAPTQATINSSSKKVTIPSHPALIP
ncbi:MAG: hypothetical protein DLM72_15860 [Candidatus Nitrosopolaris wilkensis]|nr:MAG: hypothetical protein DLM72_15860 [Candidatus Nitrosopolaris wilkensis]